MPSTWQTAAARQLYLDELRRLGRFLVELGGKSPDRRRAGAGDARLRSCASVPTVAGATVTVARRWRQLPPQRARSARNPAGRSRRPAVGNRRRVLRPGGTGRRPRGARRHGRRPSGRCPGRSIRRESRPTRSKNWPTPISTAFPTPFAGPTAGFTSGWAASWPPRHVRGIIFRRYRVVRPLARRVAAIESSGARCRVLEIDVGPDDIAAPNRVQGRIEAFLEMLK